MVRAVLDIVFVRQPDELDLGDQPPFQRLRQHCHAVFDSLAAANDDFPPVKIEITNPQLTALGNPHPGSVQQFDDESVGALLRYGGEQSADFVFGEHGRQPLGPVGPYRIERTQILFQHVAVQEQDRPSAWFCVLSATRRLTARRERKASTFCSPISWG